MDFIAFNTKFILWLVVLISLLICMMYLMFIQIPPIDRLTLEWRKRTLDRILGLPKCKYGGRCNGNIETTRPNRFIPFDSVSSYFCSKCGEEMTKYYKI